MNIDETTGLPEAPDCHFWRLREIWGLVRVGLRRKTWYGSREVDAVIPLADRGMSRMEAVNWGANVILERVDSKRWAKSMVGDYPPKKLG